MIARDGKKARALLLLVAEHLVGRPYPLCPMHVSSRLGGSDRARGFPLAMLAAGKWGSDFEPSSSGYTGSWATCSLPLPWRQPNSSRPQAAAKGRHETTDKRRQPGLPAGGFSLTGFPAAPPSQANQPAPAVYQPLPPCAAQLGRPGRGARPSGGRPGSEPSSHGHTGSCAVPTPLASPPLPVALARLNSLAIYAFNIYWTHIGRQVLR